MIYAVQEFVKEKLGPRYISNKSVPFPESYEESGPSTPIFFILSPGVDPLKVHQMRERIEVIVCLRTWRHWGQRWDSRAAARIFTTYR